MRVSKQRDLILKTLAAYPTHPTAEALYAMVRTQNPRISLGTVYRNLNLLTQAGMVRKIEGLNSTAHFDHTLCSHYHFICLDCGDVFDIPCEVARDIQTKAQEATGFEITGHDIVLKGRCIKCKKNKGELKNAA